MGHAAAWLPAKGLRAGLDDLFVRPEFARRPNESAAYMESTITFAPRATRL